MKPQLRHDLAYPFRICDYFVLCDLDQQAWKGLIVGDGPADLIDKPGCAENRSWNVDR